MTLIIESYAYMLDMKLVRENPDKFRQAYTNRSGRYLAVFEELLALDEVRRKKITQTEEIQAKRNQLSKQIGEFKMKKAEPPADLTSQAEQLKKQLDAGAAEMKEIEEKSSLMLLSLPNVPHPQVPVGKTPEENKTVRTWGEPRKFDFKAGDHHDVGTNLGIIDFEAATAISGSRFALLKDKGAKLERAIASFMLDLAAEHGYKEMLTPYLVLGSTLQGTGQLPKFEEDLYKMNNTEGEPDLYLIPTSEVPLVNILRGKVVDEKDLPIAYTAWTPCFRREAGTYGKDTRGLIRQHQFNKVELVRFALAEKSYEQLEVLTGHAEEVLKRLELPYRVLELCTGDMGFGSSRTYDLEVWMAGEGRYREISSCSNCEDFQARRANIKVARTGGKKEFLHTLNGSGLAVGRTFAAILENYQKADGSVEIPKALQKYLPFKEIALH